MPREDNPVQVAVDAVDITSPIFDARAIEMGAEGDLVKLLSVRYFVESMPTNIDLQLINALSGNPTRIDVPHVTDAEFLSDRALYGMATMTGIGTNIGAAGSYSLLIENQIIPLHGIVRPRRQLWCYHFQAAAIALTIRIELYYKPVKVDRVTYDLINRKYGLYRRT